MGAPSPSSDMLLIAHSLKRTFGATVALSECSMSVTRGTTHAVIGENGSGKSTLVKILSGALAQNSGTIHFSGLQRPQKFNIEKARTSGVATVFQEILILEELSVLDNIWLGHHTLYREHVSRADRAEIASVVLGKLMGSSAPKLGELAKSLDLGTRQAVTIARSLVLKPKLLILDEATSALDIRTRDRLFEEVASMKATGQSVLLITHKMDEIALLADEVSVLRDGVVVRTLPVLDATPKEMLALMSGRNQSEQRIASSNSNRPVALNATKIVLKPTAKPFSVEILAGEVLGLASLEGHGGDLFTKALSGLHRPVSGNVVNKDSKPLIRRRDFVAAKIAYVPRDRKSEGIFAGLSLLDNFAISTLGVDTRGMVVIKSALRKRFAGFASKVSLKFNKAHQPIKQLSGGNQQKIILARAVETGPFVLVLNDPTRGVDQMTKVQIHSQLRALTETGVAIVIHSTEVAELISVCDRIAVFHANELYQILGDQDLLTSKVVEGMFGRAA